LALGKRLPQAGSLRRMFGTDCQELKHLSTSQAKKGASDERANERGNALRKIGQ
jgi:hypothetical protein